MLDLIFWHNRFRTLSSVFKWGWRRLFDVVGSKTLPKPTVTWIYSAIAHHEKDQDCRWESIQATVPLKTFFSFPFFPGISTQFQSKTILLKPKSILLFSKTQRCLLTLTFSICFAKVPLESNFYLMLLHTAQRDFIIFLNI